MINLSTGAFYESATRQIENLRARANDLQSQIGSGERLSKSSDDPVAAARLRTLSRNERLAEIDTVNSNRAMNDLKFTDSALTSMADIVIRAKELAGLAANGTTSAEQRATIGIEIADLRQALLVVANSRNGSGHALFGGESPGMAYAESGGAISYIGTAETVPVELGEDQRVIPGLTGPEVLSFEYGGAATDMFAVLGNLAAALQGGVPDPGASANEALNELDAGLSRIATSQTIVGGRMNWIDLMDARREANGELMADEKTSIGGADPATTILRLQEAMTVLEASQASFVKLAGISLFNIIR